VDDQSGNKKWAWNLTLTGDTLVSRQLAGGGRGALPDYSGIRITDGKFRSVRKYGKLSIKVTF